MTLATLSNVTLTETTIRPIDVVGGRLYGADVATNMTLYESEDNGDNWTAIHTFATGSALLGLRQLADGEVLAIRRDSGLDKSSGWQTNRSTATWDGVLAPTSGAWILPWGVDVSGNVVIATEYALPREASRYVYVSTDDGDTWDAVLDLDAMHPGDSAATHWHAVCIDPWADNRLWASNGDVDPIGIYYSDDLGDNWTALPNNIWQPTVLTATPYGIVGGTDTFAAGLLRILRNKSPMHVEGMYGIGNQVWYGFAERGWRDPLTNLVYVCWRVDGAESVLDTEIMVSDGKHGHTLHQLDKGRVATVMTNGGMLIADYIDDATGTRWLMRGDLS